MEALVFDRETLDELNDQAKDPKQKVIAAHKAEDLVFSLFQSDFPDLRRVNKTPGAMDMYSYRYKLRIEVKTKHNENIHALEQKFLANIKLHREDMSFVYINIAPHKRTHFFSSKVYIINGYELTKSMYQLLVSNIKEKFDNPSMFKSIQEATGEDSQDIQEIVSHFDEKLAHLENLILKNEDGAGEAAETAEGSAEEEVVEDDVSEAFAKLNEVFGTERSERESVFDSVFLEQYGKLKSEYIINKHLSESINERLKLKGLPRSNMTEIKDYFLKLGCQERRFHINPDAPKETTKVFSFRSETTIKNIPRNGSMKFQKIEKNISEMLISDIKEDTKKYQFEEGKPTNRKLGHEIIANPSQLLALHKTFYSKFSKVPTSEYRCFAGDEEINISEQLSYLSTHSKYTYNFIIQNIYNMSIVVDYESEYTCFMKALREAVEDKTPFIEITYQGYKRKNLNLFWMLSRLRFVSSKDKPNVDLKRIQTYEKHADELNKFMLKNKDVIQNYNLHAKETKRRKIDGSFVITYCYNYFM